MGFTGRGTDDFRPKYGFPGGFKRVGVVFRVDLGVFRGLRGVLGVVRGVCRALGLVGVYVGVITGSMVRGGDWIGGAKYKGWLKGRLFCE